MGSFLRDVNYQAIVAKPVVTVPGTNQVAFDTTLDRVGGIYVGGAGTVVVKMAGDSTGTLVTFSGVAAGTFLPIQVVYISSTSSATNLIALF